MSGTRSPSPTAPATDAAPAAADLVIVAHGERGGAANNLALARLAAAVAERTPFATVRGSVLKGDPAIEQAVAAGRGREMHVYPLFMSDGYYVRRAIPARLGLGGGTSGRRLRIHRPFGLERGLARVIARVAARALAARGLSPSASGLLLVGHGSSKSADSRNATEWQRGRVAALASFAEVRTAYLENPPFLPAALAALPPGPCAVVGFFSGEGQHAAADVPAALEATGRRDLVYAGAIGTAPEAAPLIAASVCAAAVRSAVSRH